MELILLNLRKDYQLIRKVNPDIALRLAALIEYKKIENEFRLPGQAKGKKIKIIALCQGLDISLRTLYRWRKAYLINGIVGLTRRKAPGKRAEELTSVQKFLVEEMRKKYKWGSLVISVHLEKDHSEKVSRYRIERYLTMSGLRDKYPCTTRKKKTKKNKHTKVVKIHHPGEHTQLDTKHQPNLLQDGKKCYVFNFIDHASNWSFKRAYSSISPKSTVAFMKELLSVCPFKINRIQTDNGTEYTYKYYKRYADIEKVHPFEKFCKDRGIVHKLIPPGVKELQGLVERSHRQDDQELYGRIEPEEIDAFNLCLNKYYQERNSSRRFRKLDWETPDQWLKDYLYRSISFIWALKDSLKNRSHKLVPKEKNKVVSLLSEQVTIAKNKNAINNCKDREKNVDKDDIKKVA